MQVLKRNGTIEAFNEQKLTTAILKAKPKELVLSTEDADKLYSAIAVVKASCEDTPKPVPTSTIMQEVEFQLMRVGLYDLAKDLILYRDKHKPDIFRKRLAYKPFEYPALAEYVTAINHSYWIFSHYNYNSDMNDLKTNMNDGERTLAKRAILAISQIEVSVKRFWSKIGERFPKPEIEEIAATFAESEVRHAKAYSNLLEVAQLNEEFLDIVNVPAIQSRINYLEKSIANSAHNSNTEYLKAIALFSILTESISLFSQFYIILSFKRNKLWLTGTANAVKATRQEEQIHYDFGCDLIKTIINENPTWWTKDLEQAIIDMTNEALKAEFSIIDWMYANGGDTVVPKQEVKDFLIDRTVRSLKQINIDYPVDSYTISTPKEAYEWFYLGLVTRSAVDFFNQKDAAYTKGAISFDENDELF